MVELEYNFRWDILLELELREDVLIRKVPFPQLSLPALQKNSINNPSHFDEQPAANAFCANLTHQLFYALDKQNQTDSF